MEKSKQTVKERGKEQGRKTRKRGKRGARTGRIPSSLQKLAMHEFKSQRSAIRRLAREVIRSLPKRHRAAVAWAMRVLGR